MGKRQPKRQAQHQGHHLENEGSDKKAEPDLATIVEREVTGITTASVTSEAGEIEVELASVEVSGDAGGTEAEEAEYSPVAVKVLAQAQGMHRNAQEIFSALMC